MKKIRSSAILYISFHYYSLFTKQLSDSPKTITLMIHKVIHIKTHHSSAVLQVNERLINSFFNDMLFVRHHIHLSCIVNQTITYY